MSVILGLLTAIVLITIGWLRSKRHQEREHPVIVRRFLHPGHAWMRETEDGDVLVGIDDFAQNVIGSIEEIRLPRLLKRVRQGGVAWHIRHGNRIVPILSPVSGRVVEKNEMVRNNPSLVNTSPYRDGWLLRIKPAGLPLQLRNLLTGKPAQQWQESVRSRLGQFFSGTPALMYQDGGELVHDLADKCSDQEWDALVKEFFLAETTITR